LRNFVKLSNLREKLVRCTAVFSCKPTEILISIYALVFKIAINHGILLANKFKFTKINIYYRIDIVILRNYLARAHVTKH